MAAAIFMTDITEMLTQVAEAAAGIGGVLSSYKLLDLSKDYYKLYKGQRIFYHNNFVGGLEQPLFNYVMGIAIPTLNYASRVSTAYDIATGPFGGQSGSAQGWWERHAAAYGAILDPRLTREMLLDDARIKTDWTNYLFRFEEQYYDVRTDIRWRKRLALHNIGIKQGTAVVSTLDSSLKLYQGHIADFSNQLATYGNGIARYVGYKRGLSDTVDDFDRVTYKPRLSDMVLNRDSKERIA